MPNSPPCYDWVPSLHGPWTWRAHVFKCPGEFWEQPLKGRCRFMPRALFLSRVIETQWERVWGADGVQSTGTSLLWSSWAFPQHLGQIALGGSLTWHFFVSEYLSDQVQMKPANSPHSSPSIGKTLMCFFLSTRTWCHFKRFSLSLGGD